MYIYIYTLNVITYLHAIYVSMSYIFIDIYAYIENCFIMSIYIHIYISNSNSDISTSLSISLNPYLYFYLDLSLCTDSSHSSLWKRNTTPCPTAVSLRGAPGALPMPAPHSAFGPIEFKFLVPVAGKGGVGVFFCLFSVKWSGSLAGLYSINIETVHLDL